jgi:uncharacterized membrane protein
MADTASEATTTTAETTRAEPHWPLMVVLLAAILLQFLLPYRLDLVSRWILPTLEVIVFGVLIVISPQQLTEHHAARHRLAIGLVALASIANGISLVELCSQLLRHEITDGHQLIVSGAGVWLTNILVFSLWYWIMDAGGPGPRAEGRDDPLDFLFPQAALPQVQPGWRPLYVDYLYLAVTNAATFGPTDTMPLSPTAKMTMSLQSLVSLVTIGLVISRAINIL